MVTKRTPIVRFQRPPTTEAAIAAYRQMKELLGKCSCPPRGDPTAPGWTFQLPCC
jgi:hypothetical protein